MDLQHLRASDGTGEAVLAHVDATRTIGSTVLSLDNIDNWNTKCVVVTGTPAANGFISPTGMTIMYGHTDSGDFIIDGYAPGYSDAGNTTAEVAIIKMTTNWADTLVDLLEVSLENDGLLKSTALDHLFKESELIFDHVASGCVLTGTGYGSTLAWSLTAGVVYINGRRYTVAAATGVVVATKDTYFDVLQPVSGTVATLVYTGANSGTVNAASPALAANSIRIAIIQSGANIASVAAINQGQKGKVLPIASSIPYMTTDSLGNLICPRDPNRKLLGYRQRIVDQNFTTEVEVPELVVPIIGVAGRNIKITVGGTHHVSGAAAFHDLKIYRGRLGSAPTLLNLISHYFTGSGQSDPVNGAAYDTLTTASNTFSLTLTAGAGTGVFKGATTPGFLMVELE